MSLKRQWLVLPPPPHVFPANWNADPMVEVIAEDDRAKRFTKPGSLTTWRAQVALDCPRLLLCEKENKPWLNLFAFFCLFNVNFTLYNWNRSYTRKINLGELTKGNIIALLRSKRNENENQEMPFVS